MVRTSFSLILVLIGIGLAHKDARAQAATETVLYNFCSETNCADGYGSSSTSLLQAGDGNFYGVDFDASSAYLYRLTPSGVLTKLFTLPAGLGPNSLLLGGDGNFYATSDAGGDVNEQCGSSSGCGTVIKITPSGTVTPLYNFCSLANCADGSSPFGLLQGVDGDFYGFTAAGGNLAECSGIGCGTVFQLTPAGTLTTLYSFCSQANCTDGSFVYGLLQGADGNLYGNTLSGGSALAQEHCTQSSGCGTIFKIAIPSLSFSSLYSFCSQTNCQDGSSPTALSQGADGNFYGTTIGGGNYLTGCTSSGCGTVYKMTPSGSLSTLYKFCSQANCDDGGDPGNLALGGDGNFYGNTQFYGGNCSESSGCGTYFHITPAGSFTELYSFCGKSNCADGFDPNPKTLQGSDGNFYGITTAGGVGAGCGVSTGCGVFYRITPTVAVNAPINISLSSSTVSINSPVTLSWSVLNGFSATLRQCYAFVHNSATGAGNWTGLQTGSITDGAYRGSATITPTAEGTFTYALTCGGVESGYAGLVVGGGKDATSVTVTSNSPVTLGSSAMLTATPGAQQYLAPFTGSVTFTSGNVALGTVQLSNGSASLDLTAQNIPPGEYPVIASYSGDASYQPSTATTNVVVLGYATETALTATPTTAAQGQSVVLTAMSTRATVSGTPSGSVSFYYGTTLLGAAKLYGGKASISETISGNIVPGTYAVTARYLGDAVDQLSTSAAINVVALAATSTLLAANPNPVPADHAVTLTTQVREDYGATVPTGSVTFSVGSTVLATEVLNGSGSAVLNQSDVGYAAGTYPVTVKYSGDASNAASSATVNLVVQ